MSDPINWLHSTKKLCQVVIEKNEQRIVMPLKEEVTSTYPELHELMESIQLHHLKEDDVILIKGLQQHSEATTDSLQNSTEGVMCLSPSPSYNSSSVFCSLRKYALGFQHAIHVITGNFPDINCDNTEKTQHIPTTDISLPDTNTPQRIKVPAPDVSTYLRNTSTTGVNTPSLPSTDLPISEQLCQQKSVSQRLSSRVHSSACNLAEGIQLPNVTTDIAVGTPSNLPWASGSQFFEVLSNYAEFMSNEILSTVIEDSTPRGIEISMKQLEVWKPMESHFSSEMLSHDNIPHSHLNQNFAGIDELPKSAIDNLSISSAIGNEKNLDVSKDERKDVLHYGIAHLASTEASSIIQQSFQEVESQMEENFVDAVSQSIIANSSGDIVVLPVMENYAMRLIHEVISDSTKEASLGKMVTRNKLQLFEEENKNSHLAYNGSHKNKDLSEVSQSDILTHELNHLTRNTKSSSCAEGRPLVEGEQVESLTKASQQCFDGSSPDRERHLSASDKENSDDHDYEKLVFDKLGLTKKGSLDYPDAPPPTPLRPQLGGSQRSFTRKLKGGLAKEFLPSPPPPTPKETINFCLSEENQDTEEKAEFMRKLIRSLSQEFNRKDTTGSSEVLEEERLQNSEPQFLTSENEPSENSCTDEKTVQDYFSHLISGIVFSSAQVVCSIMGESIVPKAVKGQHCDSITINDEYQLNTQASKELNPFSSDTVIQEAERISNEHNENKHGASFPVNVESLLRDYADRLAQKIINSVIKFLNKIDLLDHRECNTNGKGEISSENANKDCRHSHHIKQISSMSEEWVKGMVQSALQVFKTQYQLKQASSTNTESMFASEQLQNMDPAARSTDTKPFFIGASTEQHHIKKSLKTMKSQASRETDVLCSDPLFTEEQNPVTPGSEGGIGIRTIASPHEGTNDGNNNYLSFFNPYEESQIDVKTEELTGKNQSCFVQAGRKICLFEDKRERLCQHKYEDTPLALNSESIINDEEKSSNLELPKVILKDPEHRPTNKTYAESLAETILKSSLVDACRHCSAEPVTEEVPMHSPNPDELCRKLLSVANSSGDQSPKLQQKIKTEESFKDGGVGGVPIIQNTKSQRLNVVEYTDITSPKQAQQELNHSVVTLQCQAEEQEGYEEMHHSTSLASSAINLSLVNFNSKSPAVDAQVQAMLQWAAASQLNISKIHIMTSSEDFVQFPTLLTLAEDEEWTVGGLIHAVLNFYEKNQTAATPTLFDYLLEHLDSLQTPSVQHMTSI
ncbi:uncharacterized protein LOC121281964 isoform X2 [Carcharodon carcharias]|uniref:uncharacterized protein LOC121281964 isoform X2 n=1 Tax=Carcharodon carcharias TaxID=13397 RepID=UPI001B7F54F3|nr:uncharacterized protein LOC121281964 isoform X2 [Carcharodon carcharias]